LAHSVSFDLKNNELKLNNDNTGSSDTSVAVLDLDLSSIENGV